jgi:hypothetical protein
MTKDEALDLALAALEHIDYEDNDRDFLFPYQCTMLDNAITAIKQARALDKKAENARELGLDYEPVLKDNSNYRYDPPVAEPDYKALWQQMCERCDEMDKELSATDRQVEILSDALAESRREVAALKAVQEQKPFAYANPDDLCADTAFRWCKIDKFTMPVYTTPPAAQPAPVQEPVKTGDTLFRQFMSEADKAGITHWPTPPAPHRQWFGLEREIAAAVLDHCYGPSGVSGGMIERTTEVIKAKLKENT